MSFAPVIDQNPPKLRIQTALVPFPTSTSTPRFITVLHQMREDSFESVFQRTHVRVWVFLQLEGVGDNFDGPVALFRVLTSLEAQEEVAREFAVDAEGVHTAARVGLHIGGKPLFCESES